MEAHPGLSGIVALPDGHDAFAARALLADAAERTLDARYYMWHNDMSGSLLFSALRRAADRGVQVRLLLDDNNTAGLDTVLAALDAHANIAVRLFNPFRVRRWRLLGYITDFQRLNRRMHNKSFTADGQVTVIGGRNIGDEYFDAGQAPWFVDLDVLAIGPVVSDVSRDFDRYWASASSIPAARVLPRATATSIAGVAADAARAEHHPDAAAYRDALARSSFVRDLLAHRLPFDWAGTRMLSDDPAKGLGRAPEDALLWHRLKEILRAPMRELRLVSPYFVPGSAGVEALAVIARQGVKVAVLTNALEATDVAVVHAGYAKRRKSLLAAGITLFELKRGSSGSRKRVDWTGRSGSGLLGVQPACQDVRGRPFAGVRRFVQLRSPFGPAQHRNGVRDRQCCVGRCARPAVRPRSAGPRLSGWSGRHRSAALDRSTRRRGGRTGSRARYRRLAALRRGAVVGAADRVASVSSQDPERYSNVPRRINSATPK